MVGGATKYSKNKTGSQFLLSWNMQGSKWQDIMNYMSYESASSVLLVCLQECGSLPKLYKDENVSDEYSLCKERGLWIVHRNWEKTINSRCSLAIVSRVAPSGVKILEGKIAQRPVVGCKVNDLWVFTLHSNASGRAAAAAKELIDEVVREVGGDDWIVAGDFNCQTTDVQGNYDIRRTDPTAVRSGDAYNILKNQDLDFIVQKSRSSCKKRLSLHQGRGVPNHSAMKSDHPAQLFQIWSTKGT